MKNFSEECQLQYENLTFETFLECRDSMYICIDKIDEFNKYPFINGIIACKRTTMDQINISSLLYYCQSNSILYSIEALYILNCSEYENCKNIVKDLIETNSVDKNDAFIVMRLSDTDYLTINLLLQHNFYLESLYDNIYTFIKPPTYLINRDN